MAKFVAIVLGVGAVLHLVLLQRDLRGQGTYVDSWVPLAVGLTWLAVYLVVSVLAVREVVSLTRRGALRELRSGGLLVKLVGIAFFGINFLALTVVLAEAGGDHPNLVLGTLVALTYVVMLPTSAYGIGMLVALRRTGAAGTGYVVLNTIAHALFVVDVVSTVAVAIRATQVLRGTFLFDGDLAARVAALPPYGSRGITPAAWFHAAVMLASVAVPYLAVAAAQSDSGAGPLLVAVLVLWVGAGITAAVLTLLDAARLSRTRELGALAGSGLTIKIAAIPFFVQNYLILSALVFGTLLIGSLMAVGVVLGFGAVLITPLLVVGTYVLMVPTSAPGIACLLLMRRDGVITNVFFVTNLIMHLVFVAGLVSAIVVARHARRVLALGRAASAPIGR